MFHIGEFVVHPLHGAGVIDAIVQERIAGSTQDYYVFKMPSAGLQLKIPTSNSQAIGIRALITAEEAEALLQAIPELEAESSANWTKRYQENLERLKSGDLYEVARVIKSLMNRESRRGLSTGERKMLHNAKQILISEIVICQQAEYGEVEARVDRAMTQ